MDADSNRLRSSNWLPESRDDLSTTLVKRRPFSPTMLSDVLIGLTNSKPDPRALFLTVAKCGLSLKHYEKHGLI